MITATLHETAYQTVVSNGTSAFVVDSEKDGRGGATGLRPPELLEAALAACVNLTLRISADKMGIPLRRLKTTVRMESDQARTVLHLDVDMDDDLAPRERERLLDKLQLCPVSRVLGQPVVIAGPHQRPA